MKDQTNIGSTYTYNNEISRTLLWEILCFAPLLRDNILLTPLACSAGSKLVSSVLLETAVVNWYFVIFVFSQEKQEKER